MLTVELVRSDAWLGAALAMQVWELVVHVIDEVSMRRSESQFDEMERQSIGGQE